jgi:hypothetical protein
MDEGEICGEGRGEGSGEQCGEGITWLHVYTCLKINERILAIRNFHSIDRRHYIGPAQ